MATVTKEDVRRVVVEYVAERVAESKKRVDETVSRIASSLGVSVDHAELRSALFKEGLLSDPHGHYTPKDAAEYTEQLNELLTLLRGARYELATRIVHLRSCERFSVPEPLKQAAFAHIMNVHLKRHDVCPGSGRMWEHTLVFGDWVDGDLANRNIREAYSKLAALRAEGSALERRLVLTMKHSVEVGLKHDEE